MNSETGARPLTDALREAVPCKECEGRESTTCDRCMGTGEEFCPRCKGMGRIWRTDGTTVECDAADCDDGTLTREGG